MDIPLPDLGVTPPLHWILADKWGDCIVLEPTNEGLKMYDNPLGVMTNSPEFNWHLQNLRQYIGLKSQPFAPTEWSNLLLSAFGQDRAQWDFQEISPRHQGLCGQHMANKTFKV